MEHAGRMRLAALEERRRAVNAYVVDARLEPEKEICEVVPDISTDGDHVLRFVDRRLVEAKPST